MSWRDETVHEKQGPHLDDRELTPPRKTWTWDKENGGKWAGLNRPIAGPTHEKALPVGKHPFQLYSLATPNGVKVTVMLRGAARQPAIRRLRCLAEPHWGR